MMMAGLDPEGSFTGGGGGGTSSRRLELSGASRERGEKALAHWRGVRGCSPGIFFKSMSLRMHFRPF